MEYKNTKDQIIVYHWEFSWNIPFVINCNNPVRFLNHKESDNRRYGLHGYPHWSHHHWVCLGLHGEKNWDRLNPEELWQCLQDAWRNRPANLPEKLCATLPWTKTVLNAKGGLHLCFFILGEFFNLFTSKCTIFKKLFLCKLITMFFLNYIKISFQ